MRKFQKTTIKDVASRAGVSTTTVSLFISGRDTVCSHQTADRIRRAVTELNYTPSSLTRGLRQADLTTIGVCLSSPMDPDVAYGAWFFEHLWRGIIAQADCDNYSLLHYPIAVRDGGNHDAFLDGRVDGVLLHDHGNARTAHLCRAGMPAVLLTRSINLPENCGAAYADDRATAHLALNYLWEMGHRRIAHVAGPVGALASSMYRPDIKTAMWEDDIAVQRLEGYRSFMQQRSLFDPDLITFPQAWSFPQSLAVLRSWMALDRPPTAIFCANDFQALETIESARLLGCTVPDGLSTVSVDDSQLARGSNPQLTSVKVPVDEIGRTGVRALLHMIAGKPIDQCRIAVPVTNLVVGNSTAPPLRPGAIEAGH